MDSDEKALLLTLLLRRRRRRKPRQYWIHAIIERPQSAPTGLPAMGPSSISTECPSCGTRIHTSTSKKAKSSAWWACILMCICGCFCGCCLIPCCMNSCNIVNHSCPKCHTYLGQYRP